MKKSCPRPQRGLNPPLTTFLDPTTNLQEIQMEKHVKLHHGDIITKIQTTKISVRHTTLAPQQINGKKTKEIKKKSIVRDFRALLTNLSA